jgi:nucleoside-diphosphate-sugar epimerase
VTQLTNRKILLVGGAGFIGHNLALRLKSLGAEVEIIDSLGVNNLHSLKRKEAQGEDISLYLSVIHERLRLLKENNIILHEQDSRDYDALSDLVLKIQPDSVVHMAAVAHANVSNKDPFSTFDHSFRTLENMLDIARSDKNKIEHFIYFSSSMVYGNFPAGFVTEETPCDPLGIYGALKYSGEKIVIAYNQVFDMPYTIIRPSALYGERCVSRRVGQIFIEHAIQNKVISINGDGTDALDFTYIDDFVSGVVAVLGNKASHNEIFNLTYGEGRTIGQMAELIKTEFPNAKIEYKPKDRLMPDRGTLSVEKAKRLIGYQPANPLEVGFVKYIEWYKELFNQTKQTQGG